MSKCETQQIAQQKLTLSNSLSPIQKCQFTFWIKFGFSQKSGLSKTQRKTNLKNEVTHFLDRRLGHSLASLLELALRSIRQDQENYWWILNREWHSLCVASG